MALDFGSQTKVRSEHHPVQRTHPIAMRLEFRFRGIAYGFDECIFLATR